MKLKNDFILRKIAEKWVILPLSDRDGDFSGMMTLNETGLMLWKLLEDGAERTALCKALCDRYGITPEQANADTDRFLAKLESLGCLEQ